MHSVLETPRLTLRELEPEDLDFVAEMLAHPDVNRYYEKQFTRNDAAAWLDRQRWRYEHDGHGLWLAVRRDTGEPVGQIGLMIQEVEGERRPEVGWLLHRPCWGQGYATEAAAAVRDAGWNRWGYGELVSLIRPVNRPSRHVAERIGMQPGPRVQFHGFDHIVYSIQAPGTPSPTDRDRG